MNKVSKTSLNLPLYTHTLYTHTCHWPGVTHPRHVAWTDVAVGRQDRVASAVTDDKQSCSHAICNKHVVAGQYVGAGLFW